MSARVQPDFPTAADPEYMRMPRRGRGGGWLKWIAAAAVRWQQRRILEQIDERMLRDIGISRSEALAEARKPFWR